MPFAKICENHGDLSDDAGGWPHFGIEGPARLPYATCRPASLGDLKDHRGQFL